MAARLLIVEDHGLLAETVGAALRTRGYDVEVVDARGTSDVVATVVAREPDLTLLDLELGRPADAAELIPDLQRHGVPVVMMTGVRDPVRLARCVRAGAVGVIDKAEGFDHLVGAVEAAVEHGTLLTRHEREEHLRVLREHEAHEDRRLAPFRRLTPREREVLAGLCDGRSLGDIATDRGVSVATVRTQVKAVLRKLEVGSQRAATVLARDASWPGPDR